jgi:starch phosphorylase
LNADEVFALKDKGYNPMDFYQRQPELRLAIDQIASGYFSNGDAGRFRPIVESLLAHDEYLLLADYPSYVACQNRVDAAYQDTELWTRMSILNTARCGFFSSDRTIRQYCEDIWKVKPLKI